MKTRGSRMVVESACNVGCGGGVLFFIKTGSEERERQREFCT